MPSEKRARQRAAREARRLEELKKARRRALLRNAAVVLVIAAVIITIVIVSTSSSPKKTVASQSGTSTTAKGATTTTAPPATTTTATPATTTTAPPATTTTAPVTTPTAATATPANFAAEQATANAKATAAGCPATPKTKVNTLSWKSPPKMTINTKKTYTATIKTTAGTIVATLDAKKAPNTVNSFVFLAKQNYFHCVIFSRVVPGFMNQTGDPTGTDTGGPGYHIKNEDIPKAYATGDLAMANSGGNDTNGSQFFMLATGGAPILDNDLARGGYSLFGMVTSGMTVVTTINGEGNATHGANGIPPKVIQRMLTVTITT